MNQLIFNYLEAIGGVTLIRRIRHHALLCCIEAKGIHQTWKEFYDYESGAFRITTANDGYTMALTEGNRSEAHRKFKSGSKDIDEGELDAIHTSMMLVPEIKFLDENFIRSVYEDTVSVGDDISCFSFRSSKYDYTFIFDNKTGLKKEVKLADLSDERIKLDLQYSQWSRFEGLLYPAVLEMISEHQVSKRMVLELEIGYWDS